MKNYINAENITNRYDYDFPIKVTKHFHQRFCERLNINDFTKNQMLKLIMSNIKSESFYIDNAIHEMVLYADVKIKYKILYRIDKNEVVLITFKDDGRNFNRFSKKDIFIESRWKQIKKWYYNILNGGEYE